MTLFLACSASSENGSAGEATTTSGATSMHGSASSSTSVLTGTTGTSSGGMSGTTTSSETTQGGTTTEAEAGTSESTANDTCGDGVLNDAEGCDDGNGEDGDGCSSECWPEFYSRCIGAGPDSCSPIRILFGVAANDTPAFRQEMASITGGPVEFIDLTFETPSLAELESNYDCVFTHPSSPFDDLELWGDILASYVDNGANVVLGVYSGQFGATAIGAPGYAPVTIAALEQTFVTYAGDGATLLHSGVREYSHNLVDSGVMLQGDGQQDGSFTNGTIATAYRPDYKVVYVNGSGQGDFVPEGDWARLIANACAVGYLGQRGAR